MPRRWRRLLVWGTSLFIAYTIIGLLILPLVIRVVGLKQISKQLDRQAKIDRIRINPFVLSLSLRGLLILDKDGEPFVSWDEFFVNFQLSSFFGKPWVFKEVRLEHPFVRAQMNKDYTFNFSDLLKKFSAESSPKKTASKPLFLKIERLNITGARASLTDLTPRVPFHRAIGPVELTVTQFRTDPQSQNPYSFSGTTDSGERFTWSGEFSLDPIRSSGELSLQDVSIAKYAALYQDLIRFDIPDGRISFQSAYSFALTPSNSAATITNANFFLRGLKVVDRSNSVDVLDLQALRVNGLSADATARSAEINEVTVQGGRVDVRRDRDERINVLDLSQPAADATNAPGGVLALLRAATNVFAAFLGTTNIWSATVHTLSVTNCELNCDDLANLRPVHFNVDQVAIDGQNLSNRPGSNQTVTVSLRWNTNGTIRVESSLSIEPTAADITLSVRDLELKPLDPYLEPFADVFIVDSKVNLEGRLALRSSGSSLPEVTFQGDAQLNDFATLDGVMAEDLVKWKSIQISGIEAGLQPPSVAVKQMTMIEPFARFAIETNHSINLLSALRLGETNEAAGTQAAPGARLPNASDRPGGSLGQKLGGFIRKVLASGTNGPGGSSLPKITLDTLAISNGSAQFYDRSIQPSVKVSVDALTGTLNGISSVELGQADVNLTGLVDHVGGFEVKGKLNPLTKNAPTDLKVEVHAVDLTPASPYSGRFLGYRLDSGKLDLQVNYTVTEKQLKAKNLVVVEHLNLGEKIESPDATHLPVRLAVALLKDRNGKIELDVPIEGNLDDPQFHFGKVITRVLGNIITKLVTSPFAVLGAVFGGKGEEVSYQDFEPGGVDLLPSQADKLAALISGLCERPGLQLRIEGDFEPVADAEGLRRMKLRGEFRRKKWADLRRSEREQTSPDQISLSAEEYQNYVQATYRVMAQTNAVANKVEAGNSVGEAGSTTAHIDKTAQAFRDSALEKGASSLMKKPTSAPEAPLENLENAVLATIPVTDDDLNQLALERGRRTQQKILESGKLDAARVSLTSSDPGTSKRHAARVYFHLE